jgi:serine/threonine protein kinase
MPVSASRPRPAPGAQKRSHHRHHSLPLPLQPAAGVIPPTQEGQSRMAKMPEVGDLIAGKYRIERALSSGGMGSVYVASHLQTGREFALKVMSSLLAGDEEAEARFWREAKLATSIDHPAIIEVYDVGRDGQFPFMVMKLLRGESLGERLKRGAMPPAEAVDIMLRVLDGVAAAHACGVVHRDLKPDNIFLCVSSDRKGVELKVLDFGISKLMTKAAQTRVLTQTGIALGTPLYMSGEQLRGAAEVDHRTDVYALGVILYEMLTGQVPYLGNTYPDLVLKIITGDARPPHALVAGVPGGLSRVVMKAMALEREHRFQSVAELGAALEALGYARAEMIPQVSSVSPPGSLTPFAAERVIDAAEDMPSIVPKRPVGAWLGASAAALVVLGGGLWALGSRTGSQDGPQGVDMDAANVVSPAAEVTAPAAAAAAPALPGPGPLPSSAAIGVTQPVPTPAAPDAGAPAELPSGIAAPSAAAVHEHAHERPTHRPHHSTSHDSPVAAERPRPEPPSHSHSPQPSSQLIDPF